MRITQSVDGLHNGCSDRRSAKVKFSWIVAGLGFRIYHLPQIGIAQCAE